MVSYRFIYIYGKNTPCKSQKAPRPYVRNTLPAFEAFVCIGGHTSEIPLLVFQSFPAGGRQKYLSLCRHDLRLIFGYVETVPGDRAVSFFAPYGKNTPFVLDTSGRLPAAYVRNTPFALRLVKNNTKLVRFYKKHLFFWIVKENYYLCAVVN